MKWTPEMEDFLQTHQDIATSVTLLTKCQENQLVYKSQWKIVQLVKDSTIKVHHGTSPAFYSSTEAEYYAQQQLSFWMIREYYIEKEEKHIADYCFRNNIENCDSIEEWVNVENTQVVDAEDLLLLTDKNQVKCKDVKATLDRLVKKYGRFHLFVLKCMKQFSMGLFRTSTLYMDDIEEIMEQFKTTCLLLRSHLGQAVYNNKHNRKSSDRAEHIGAFGSDCTNKIRQFAAVALYDYAIIIRNHPGMGIVQAIPLMQMVAIMYCLPEAITTFELWSSNLTM